MAQHVAPALDDVISNTVDIFHNYYKCDYPKSPQVKDGLKRLLNERYRDDVKSFIDHFKFPLCLPNGKVVLHLVPPLTKLAVGEFFYQVGHTNPRTLVVKFAKYEQRGTKVNELQRSTVPEDDHDIAFTKEYFDQIRSEVPDGLGDVLMRTLVVMGNPNWTVQKEGAANHLGNCPTERHSRLRSESHLSVQESCDDDSSTMSEPNSPTENDDVYPSTDGVFVHTNGCDKGK
ncbi:unnamed protein product [Pocillopora meandrina]|uniref:Uncharacterized protein n=1 Tax=Pocillopora meandrina TaxID=46732 RepID=A0AAU9WW08_9CNID|nr:unnamed protein product [Pocillopora meandrina]